MYVLQVASNTQSLFMHTVSFLFRFHIGYFFYKKKDQHRIGTCKVTKF